MAPRNSPPPEELKLPDIKALKLLANELRQDIIRMVHHAGSGHPGGALGMADVFAVLFSEILHLDPLRPRMEERDRLYLSNGHICAVLYASLAHKKYFGHEELLTYRKIDSRLQGHPHNGSLPGIENSGGPLGQGISQAVGAALALRMKNSINTVYCVCGDGELNEGQCWEAMMLASHYALSNFVLIIDRNNMQIDGKTDSVLGLEPLAERISSFGFETKTIDGHDHEAITQALNEAREHQGGPVAIIARTTPGKGVSYMQGDYRWHGQAPSDEEYDQAIQELTKEQESIK